MPEVQPELFAHLLPVCLAVWQHDLLHNHRSDYGGSVETFQSALARRPLLDEHLTPARRATSLEVIFSPGASSRRRRHCSWLPSSEPTFLRRRP